MRDGLFPFLRRLYCLLNPLKVLPVCAQHLPPIGVETLADILGKCDLGRSFDRYLVVGVKIDQLPKFEMVPAREAASEATPSMTSPSLTIPNTL